MEKFQSLEEFEIALKNRKAQEINLEKLKYGVHNTNITVIKTFNYKYKLAIISVAIILSMCFATVAFAVYNGWFLENETGDVVFNYSQASESELNKSMEGFDIRSDYKDIYAKLKPALKDGDVIYYLVTDAYALDKYYRVIQKENIIKDLNELRKSTSTIFKIPEYLPDTYKFDYATISYKGDFINSLDPDMAYNNILEGNITNAFAMATNGNYEAIMNEDYFKIGEALYSEAKAAGQDYIVKKDKLTEEAELITIKYVNDEGYRLTVRIAEVENIKSLTAEFDEIEKFNVSGKEVLSIKSYINESDDYVFVDEGETKDLTYYITNNGMFDVLLMDENGFSIELTKEEAIKMIKSFK